MKKPQSYLELNAMTIQEDELGMPIFHPENDVKATRKYFEDRVNQKQRFFHSHEEKLRYMLDNQYWVTDVFEHYDKSDVIDLFNRAFSKKFRFQSFMAANTFYEKYALWSRDGETLLERYEDRLVLLSLFFGNGDIDKARQFLELLINQEYQPATPTFLNVGRYSGGEMISCFLLEMGDSLNDINMINSTGRQLSKVGGGVSHNISKTRAKGESLKGVENVTAGILPIMKNIEQSFQHIDQAGQRKGAAAVYLNILHADIEDFISTKFVSNNMDENFSMPTLSIGVVMPDIFIQLLKENKPVHLFYPHNFYQEYGEHFDEVDLSARYYEFINNPNIRTKVVDAGDIADMIGKAKMESGYPYIMFADNVNKEHQNYAISRVTMSNLCVTGDTELLTSEGYITAKALYERKDNKALDVIVDNRTKNYDVTDLGSTMVKSTPMIMTNENAEVYQVVTKSGHRIKSTLGHKYYVLDEIGNIVKKPLSEITVGDRLLIHSGSDHYGKNNNTDLAYIAGLVTGDGVFVKNGGVRIYLYHDKMKLKSDVENKVHRLIEDLDTTNNHHSLNKKPAFLDNRKSKMCQLNSVLLREVFNKYGMDNDIKNGVPDFIKCGNKETVTSYLSGLYQMDGTVNANEKYKSMAIELSSISLELLLDVQKLLGNLGVYSTIYTSKRDFNILPDSDGVYKKYPVRDIHKIVVQDRKSRNLFLDNISLKETDVEKSRIFETHLSDKSRKPKHNNTSPIVSIDYVGVEPVYDVAQEDYHSLIFNGIVTGNCTEVLQASIVSEYNDYGEEDDIGLDISCNLGSLNIKAVMESEDKDLERIVSLSIGALNRVSETSDVKNAPAVNKANRLMRSVGLGVMNLHGFFANNNLPYESFDALNFSDHFFSAIRYYAMKASMEKAKATGQPYYMFEKSGYADGSFFDDYIENKYPRQMTDKVAQLFDGFVLPTEEDWLQLKSDVATHGLYNSYLMCVAPTGSISYVHNATASVSPIKRRVENREWGDRIITYPMPNLSNKNFFLYKEGYNMDWYKVITLIATIQKHIDQGVSFEFLANDGMSTRDLLKLDLFAHHMGIKTIYYTRNSGENDEKGCVACAV